MTDQQKTELLRALRLWQDDLLADLKNPNQSKATRAWLANEAERVQDRINELAKELQEATR